MTTDQKSYADSHLYEVFMRRAHRSDRNFSRGIDNAVFLLLRHIDCGHYGQPKDYPKQVAKIKNYLIKAIEKVLKWKLNPDERQAITCAERELHYAHDEGTLANVLNKLIDATQRFKV